MAGIKPFPAATLIYLYLLTLSQVHFTMSQPTGFSLKLIHRDSPHSPFYPGNLTHLERIHRLVDISESRLLHLESMASFNSTTHPDIIRPPVAVDGFLYLVLLSVGTPYKSYYLVLDTASSVVWLQCEPCKNCFPQKEPIFDPKGSSSYQKLPCDHFLCKPFTCIEGECIFKINYANLESAQGVLSTETFTFLSDNGATEALDGIVFGCANDNQGFKFNSERAGILGMNASPLSLIGQLSNKIQRRFSYCMVEGAFSSKITSFLRFGDDIVTKGEVQTTPFLRYKIPFVFGLNLTDISIADHRMGFAPGTFDLKPDGTGGCIIDSAAALSYIDQSPYDAVKNVLLQYFAHYDLKQIDAKPYNLDLCYILPIDFYNFPTITFHFRGADLEIVANNAFIIDYTQEYFCLGIMPRQGQTILGALQQQNVRFIYDGGKGTLSFAKEDCSQDAE